MLSASAIAERRKGIGGSDARKIVEGDWFNLFLEKTGKIEPTDLSHVWAVHLGIVTEALNLDWYSRRGGGPVERRGEVVVSTSHPFLRCTLDGWDQASRAVIQAKHCNAFAKIGDIRERYAPQVCHEMIVTDASKGVLSVIIGAAEPVYEFFERDEFWEISYIEKAREFWGYVMRNEPPEKGRPMTVAPAAPAAMRTVDMTGNNAWANYASDWLANKVPAKTFETATKELKALVEADVARASGHGISCTRDKAGKLSIKESK